MTIIIPEGAIQFVLQYASDDFVRGRAATILGFRPVETATEEEMAEAVYQSYLDNLAGSLSNRIELLPALWTGATTSGTVGAGGTGSVSIETPPPNTALLTRKVTARRGRRAQGRAFWPGLLDEGNIDEAGVLDPSVRTGFQTQFDAFWSDNFDGGAAEVILQNSEGMTPPLDPAPSVSAHAVQPKVATQRRRLR